MRARSLLAALAVSATALAGCSVSGGSGGAFEGTTWLLKSYDNGTSMVDVPQGVYPDAVFAGGEVTGIAVCNSYTGTYTQSGSSLAISALASTLMACPNTSAGVEQQILAAMGRTATYTASKVALKTFDANGKDLLVYQAAPSDPLTGTTWVAAGYNNGKGAVQSVAVGTSITAIFGADGQLSGSGGCNDYSATFSAADGTIVIGPVAATQKACDQAVMDQESAYLAALGRAASYAVRGADLEIRDPAGAVQATYTKQ